MENSKEKIVQLLDKKIFDIILNKSEEDFSGEKLEKFKDLKRSTESEKKKYHEEYKTAKEVYDNYMGDLHSPTGEEKSKEAEELGLPKLKDIKDEVQKIASEEK